MADLVRHISLRIIHHASISEAGKVEHGDIEEHLDRLLQLQQEGKSAFVTIASRVPDCIYYDDYKRHNPQKTHKIERQSLVWQLEDQGLGRIVVVTRGGEGMVVASGVEKGAEGIQGQVQVVLHPQQCHKAILQQEYKFQTGQPRWSHYPCNADQPTQSYQRITEVEQELRILILSCRVGEELQRVRASHELPGMVGQPVVRVIRDKEGLILHVLFELDQYRDATFLVICQLGTAVLLLAGVAEHFVELCPSHRTLP